MKFQEIKQMLDLIDDPVVKLETVMDIGRQLAPVPDNAECSVISGCTSFVQICRVGNNFYATADSMLVRGIVAIIISMVDGCDADAIKKIDLAQMFADLKLNIGAGRLNGVNSMIRFLKNL